MTTSIQRVIVRPDEIALVNVNKPVTGPDEVGVEMLVSGVCGSDIHAAVNRPGLCGGFDSAKDDDHASSKVVSAGVAGPGRAARV